MMAKTMILPAALRYQKEVGESIAAAKAAGAAQPGRRGNASARWSARSTSCTLGIAKLEKAQAHHAEGDALRSRQAHARARLPGAGQRPQGGRQAGNHRRRRPLAAADVSGDAVHQVSDLAKSRLNHESPARFACRGFFCVEGIGPPRPPRAPRRRKNCFTARRRDAEARMSRKRLSRFLLRLLRCKLSIIFRSRRSWTALAVQ